MVTRGKINVLSLVVVFILSGCSMNKNVASGSVSLTNTQLLTAHTWQVGETYQNVSGIRTHYLRGGENTSGVDMGAMTLKFNADGGGTHTDISGRTFDMTWVFTSNDETSLRLVVNGTVTYNWVLTSISANAILQTSFVSADGLVTAKWIPVP